MANWKRRFFIIWLGQAFSMVGSSLVQFALVWWLTETTGSATILATGTLVGLLPGIIIGPFVGALVDRWNRRTVMIVADGGIALATVALALIYWGGHMQPWHVYVLMFVRAVGGGFHWPAMQASTSLMVPHDQLGRVAGMNQTLQGAMRIVSPPLGALLVALLPLHAILAIDVATAAIAIGPLLVLGIPQPDRAPAAEHTVRARARGLVRDVADGFRYIWEWRWLKVVVAMAIVANVVFNPAFSLLALVVTKHYGGGALQLGWLNSAFGIGVVLGGLILTAWGGFRIRGYSIALGLLGMGVGVLAVGVAPAGWLWLGIGGMWLAGVGSPIANGPIAALMQTSVKPDMQGRVFTAMDSLVSLASPLGMAVAGPVADAIGPEKWFAIAGAVCLGIVLLIVAKPSLLCRVDERPADAGVSAGAAMVQ